MAPNSLRETTGAPSGAAAPDLRGLRVLTTCEFLPWRSCGGSDIVAWQVARRLVRWNAEVALVTGRPHGEQGVLEEEIEGVRVIGVPTVELSRRLGVELTVPRGIWPELRRAAAELAPTVVHAHSLHFPSSVAAAAFARRARLPLVLTAHIGGLDRLPLAVRAATAMYERTVGRLLLARAREVVAVSDAVAAHVRRRAPEGVVVSVAPNGVDCAEFAPDGAARATDVPPHVVFVGRLIANKGADLVAEALAALGRSGEQFTASFVGDGPLRDRLERRVADLGLSGRIAFTGAVRDVAARLRRADVLVRPSLTEGLPLAVLEAMASGTCVIASDIPGNADLIEHGVSGLLVPPGSLARLTDAIGGAVRSTELRRRLAEGGARVAARHSWDETARVTSAALARAASPAVR